MLLSFGYSYNSYKFVMFYFFFFVKKQKIIGKNKASWPKFCNIIFLFLLKIGLVGPVDQQINLVSPHSISYLACGNKDHLKSCQTQKTEPINFYFLELSSS